LSVTRWKLTSLPRSMVNEALDPEPADYPVKESPSTALAGSEPVAEDEAVTGWLSARSIADMGLKKSGGVAPLVFCWLRSFLLPARTVCER